MNGHLTCIGGDYNHKSSLVEKETQKFKETQGITNLKVWGDSDLEDFLRDYNKDALYAYLKVIPGSYKSDISRFSLINHFGGWYSDMGIQFEKPISKGNYDMVMFWDMDDWIPGAMQTSIIFGNPGNEVLGNAVERCIYNAKNENYGSDPWDVTGPTLLGKAYRSVCPNSVKFGKTISYQENQVDRYFTMDGEIVAYGKNLHKQNTINNGVKYFKLWHDKQVFNDERSLA